MLPGSFIKKVRDVVFKKLDPLNANTYFSYILQYHYLFNKTRTKVIHKNISQDFRTEGLKHKSKKREKGTKLFLYPRKFEKSDFQQKIFLRQKKNIYKHDL